MASDQSVKHKNLREKTVGHEKVSSAESKPPDNEDLDSLEDQPLDIGEHYLVRRNDESCRKWFYK